MFGQLLFRSARCAQRLTQVSYSSHGAAAPHFEKAGNREQVGFGYNGQAAYIDLMENPCPAVRFREETSDIKALRQKEKGDWKQLTLDEKKCLYRFSFCQTYAEMDAPTGRWKPILGFTLLLMSATIWLEVAMQKFVYTPLPITLSLENKQHQLRRMIDSRVNPITGLSSKWDYDKDEWKK